MGIFIHKSLSIRIRIRIRMSELVLKKKQANLPCVMQWLEQEGYGRQRTRCLNKRQVCNGKHLWRVLKNITPCVNGFIPIFSINCECNSKLQIIHFCLTFTKLKQMIPHYFRAIIFLFIAFFVPPLPIPKSTIIASFSCKFLF